MGVFIDTQLLIDALHGEATPVIRGRQISSVTASELLQMQDEAGRPRYYVPIGMAARALPGMRLSHPFARTHTDSVSVEFGGQYPAIRSYSHLAIANAINEGATSTFAAAIALLPKARRKHLSTRFAFLVEHGVTCTPMTKSTVEVAQALLALFLRRSTLKRRFLNSWNDLVIAATAYREGAELITRDTLLARFVAEQCGTDCVVLDGRLRLLFKATEEGRRRFLRESKEYVNRSWQVTVTRRI